MFNVYGKGQNDQYAGVITKFLRNIIDDKPLIIYGDGEQTRDFVSINDVVNAFDCAIRSEKNGTYNIAGGESLSINSLAEVMLDVFGKKLEIIHKEMQKGDIRHSVADVSFAASELGFSATRKLKDELSSIYHE
ncbi:NAD-dependent epimerase/dehydratase [Candidatus Nitrosopumilus sediminis]|uniref:NAD-dependent epimerase/dehydratase n=1 Tax=Candidatus Nitrosopumilus sediminis TaxID=1229909 RepID=K0BDG7_9ARCH|nr:NAD-dependent epimerase/dehydratase [Candidatus Nitrosopumilus sediminis]